MKAYRELSKEELLALKEELTKKYEDVKAKGLSLDMSRGKPGVDQLELSMPMLNLVNENSDMKCESGVDCRNYGAGGNSGGKTPDERDDRYRPGACDCLWKFQLEHYV